MRHPDHICICKRPHCVGRFFAFVGAALAWKGQETVMVRPPRDGWRLVDV